jgi:hypothetical protein
MTGLLSCLATDLGVESDKGRHWGEMIASFLGPGGEMADEGGMGLRNEELCELG